jgi:hypothetical protein
MKRLFGGLLLGIGILVMTCSGLCSLYVIAVGFSEAVSSPALILFPLIVGGVPFGIGFGLFKWGQKLLNQPTEPPGY